MKVELFYSKGLLSYGFVIVSAVLLLGMIAISLIHVNPRDSFACSGQLGIGFPVSSVCNYSAGGSPLSSATKIDAGDFPFLSPHGFLVDFIFYLGVLWGFWHIERGILRLIKPRNETR